MQTDVQITFRDMEPSDAVAARIRERVAKLEQFHHRITSCRVVVEAAKRRQKATEYQVHIDLTLPGQELAVSRDHAEKKPADDMYVAIRNAFDALERRLKSMADRRRGEVKAHGAPPHGHVVRLFADHGFIATADGEIYFHRNAVADGAFQQLEVGDEVRFALAPDDGAAGPQASTVHPLGKHKIVEPRTRA
jgi:ribosomal subunit interface protein